MPSKLFNHRLVKSASLGILIAAAFIVPILLFPAPEPEVEGRIESIGAEGFSLAPHTCRSGEHVGFDGTLLSSKEQPNGEIRVARDASGAIVVTLAMAGKSATVLRDCVRGSLDRSKREINDIVSLDGNLRIDCKAQGLRGTLKFANCF